MEHKRIKVGKKFIGENEPVFIVAETGTNHNGRMDVALKMIEAAARTGADAVKFQTVNADASYIRGSLPHNIYRKISFKKDDWITLKKAADANGLVFFSAPADIPSLELLRDVKMPLIKISSPSMTNIALVRSMAGLGIPVIISTGMAYIHEVRTAAREFKQHGAKDIVLMHCTSLYPAPPEALNLNSIVTLRRVFKCLIGYSDHTTSNVSSIAAVCLGATTIEKHFTIDRKYGGPEQVFSYDESGFKKLVEDVRYAEDALGSFSKAPSRAELKLREKYRRCLVANRDIKKNECFTKEAIGMKRPLTRPGLNTGYIDKILGKTAAKDINEDEPIYSSSVRW